MDDQGRAALAVELAVDTAPPVMPEPDDEPVTGDLPAWALTLVP